MTSDPLIFDVAVIFSALCGLLGVTFLAWHYSSSRYRWEWRVETDAPHTVVAEFGKFGRERIFVDGVLVASRFTWSAYNRFEFALGPKTGRLSVRMEFSGPSCSLWVGEEEVPALPEASQEEPAASALAQDLAEPATPAEHAAPAEPGPRARRDGQDGRLIPEPAPSARRSRSQEAPGRLIGGKYELRQEIGRGGMGVVYEGFDTSLDRRVAIKRMRVELGALAGDRRRFFREAKIVASLNHPFIVGIHESVDEGGAIYLVFDYVEGKPLSTVLRERARLPLEDCVKIFDHLSQAVDYAHRNKVLHRDLKPSNVMLDANGFAKVMDFGLAREIKDAVTRLTTHPVGTLAYMAPEQHVAMARRESDVYAMGVMLFELLTGMLPFNGPDFLAQKERRLLPTLTSFAPKLPESANALIWDALEPDAAKRIETAALFFERLKGVG